MQSKIEKIKLNKIRRRKLFGNGENKEKQKKTFE